MTLHVQRGLYAISSETADTPALLDWASAVVEGGARWLQYRDKSADRARRAAQARALARLCRAREVTFFVNDDVELTAECGADGVHLGATDAAVEAARTRLGPGPAIGVSCYADVSRAAAAASGGRVDYIAFGAFFPSATKPGAVRADLDLLRATRDIGLPRVAIGGITPENGKALVDAGADLLAVVGGLAGPPEAAFAAARRYAALFDLPETPST